MYAGSDGVFVAAPIWRAFMDQNLWRFPQENFMPYDSMSPVRTINLTKVDMQAGKDNKDGEKKKR